MQTHATDFRSRRVGLPTLWVVALLAMLFGTGAMQAQLNGNYTIGGSSPSYADIPTAISALNTNGISGPVTFLIRGGTYNLTSAQTISNFTRTAAAATSRVTFKPDAGATVTIQSNSTSSNSGTGLFVLNGAHHITFDGSNNGTTSRDLTMLNTASSGSVIIMQNNADVNYVQNCKMMSNSTYYPTSPSSSGNSYSYGGIIHIWYGSTAAGNDSIIIRNNQFGDPATTPTYRYAVGVSAFGYSYSSASYMNQALRIVNNDFVNFGTSNSGYNYGVEIGVYNMNTVVDSNEIRMTTNSSTYPSAYQLIGISRTDYYGWAPGFSARYNRIHDFKTSYTGSPYFYGVYDYAIYSGNYASSYSFLSADTSNINDNQIYNFSFALNSSVNIYMYGVYSYYPYMYSAGSVSYIRRNNIYNFTTNYTGTGSYNYPQVWGVYSYTYNPYANGSVEITNNQIHDNTITNGYGSGYSYTNSGIYVNCAYASSGASTFTLRVDRNQIYNLTADGSYNYYTYLYGIYLQNYYMAGSSQTVTMTGNVIHDLTMPSTSSIYYYGYLYGIYQDGYYSRSAVVYDSNMIYNILNNATHVNSGYYDYYYGLYVNAYYPGSNGTPNGNFEAKRNQIYNMGRTSAVSTTVYNYYYGLYLNIYTTSGYSHWSNIIVDRNRVANFLLPSSGLSSMYGYWYGFYLQTQYTPSTSTVYVTNNMISLDAGTWTNLQNMYALYLYHYYSTGSTLNIYYNSVYARATGTSYSMQPVYYYCYNAGTVNHKNNILDVVMNYYYPIYMYMYLCTFTSNNNLVNISTSNNSSYPPIYYINPSGSGYTYASWDAYRSGSGQDANSMSGQAPFVSTATGDLHISCTGTFPGKGRGTPVTNPLIDFDTETRSTTTPDIGADETDKLTLTYPNGGEIKVTEDTANIRFIASKPMMVNIFMTTNNGSTWTPVATNYPAAAGPNTFTIPAASFPALPTDNARIYVAANAGLCQLYDTSDSRFRIVKPTVTILTPNGGEEMVPTDTTQIRWSSTFVPPTISIQLQYSSNSGASWTNIGGPIASPNNQQNSINWIVPNNPGPNPITTNLIRGMLVTRTEGDTTDATFTIRPTPIVDLLLPAGGETFYVGRTTTVTWNARTVDYVMLDYSTDGGINWQVVVPRVPSYVGQYEWTIPNTLTNSAIMRLSDPTRPRFTDRSNVFSIVKDSVTVLSPNGGESYQLGAPVTVNWYSQNIGTVKVEFSSNGGSTWTQVGSGINAGNFTYSFTPAEVPTEQALVRVTSEQNSVRSDVSDAFFRIAPAANIVVYTPVAGDRLVRNSTSVITWQADGINKVNILYSSNGGSTWSTVINDVSAAQSSYLWTVPNQTTNQGVIELREVGGSLRARSGVFQIVDPATPGTITVLGPNGGENYTEGDPINVTWTASGVGPITLSYSTNGDSGPWTTIASGLTGTSYAWTAPAVYSTHYRVRAVSTSPIAQDRSDADFTVAKRPVPVLSLLAPNGGEVYTVDSTYTIRWTASNLTGGATLMYSVDAGANWLPIGPVADITTGSYDWKVTEPVTQEARVKIVATTGSLADSSDNNFEISKRVLLPIMLVYPDGGEIIRHNTVDSVTWDAPADVQAVSIEYSTDGGSTNSWVMITPSTPSVVGHNVYSWDKTPNLAQITNAALVRIKVVSPNPDTRFDISSAPFTITGISGVATDFVAGAAGMQATVVPNPNTGRAELRWNQLSAGDVTVTLMQPNGAEAGVYTVGRREMGQQTYALDASNLPAGMYLYELRAGGNATRGMMVITR